MALKSFAVPVLTTDTEVVECPATLEGAIVLNVSNVSGGASTFTVKLYKQALGDTITVASSVAIAANTPTKYEVPLALEAGDKIVMTAGANGAVVVSGIFTLSEAKPAAVGFTPRGDYDSGATYNANEYVHDPSDGNTYVSLQDDNSNHAPPSSPAWWMVLAQKGNAGAGLANLVDDTTPQLGGDLDPNGHAIIGYSTTAAANAAYQARDAALSSLIRQASKTENFTITANENGYHIFHPDSDNNARTFTIPANATVPFPIGTVLMFANAINTVAIAIAADAITNTLRWVPSGATGSRSLAQYGIATAIKVTATEWWISGVGMA